MFNFFKRFQSIKDDSEQFSSKDQLLSDEHQRNDKNIMLSINNENKKSISLNDNQNILFSKFNIVKQTDTYKIVTPTKTISEKKSWLYRLRKSLSKTSANFYKNFSSDNIDSNFFENLEETLIMADVSICTIKYLIDMLRDTIEYENISNVNQVKEVLRNLIINLLTPLEKTLTIGNVAPLVIMVVGVNGAGKTTSISKLTYYLKLYNQSVLLAAGDTFRAASREQLNILGELNYVKVFGKENSDPASVIFDALNIAHANNIDVVIADTAGRLTTQSHLMAELCKIKRVISKLDDSAPHEILLVIDITNGQNILSQIKEFDNILGITGLIVTKLDSSAKGGILLSIAQQIPLPIYFLGFGEKINDIQPFSALEFTNALLSYNIV